MFKSNSTASKCYVPCISSVELKRVVNYMHEFVSCNIVETGVYVTSPEVIDAQRKIWVRWIILPLKNSLLTNDSNSSAESNGKCFSGRPSKYAGQYAVGLWLVTQFLAKLYQPGLYLRSCFSRLLPVIMASSAQE